MCRQTDKKTLVNICSGLFKSHFTDMLNLIHDKEEREQALSAIGIPNLSVQQSLISQNVRPNNLCTVGQTQYSRYSGENLDKVMLKHMMNVYGKYVDGYVQPVDLPTCWHRTFPKELCVFNVYK